MKRTDISPAGLSWLVAVAVVVMTGACAPAEEPGEDAAADPAMREPLPTPALHHVGLNVVDPAKSQEFYKTIWPAGEITTFDGKPAFKAEMYLIFTKVDQPAPGKWDFDRHRTIPQSPFWHIGINTNTTSLKEKLTGLGVTTVPMHRNAQDAEGIWRSGESPYPGMLTAKQHAEREPYGPQDGGFGYFVGPDLELVEASGGPRTQDTFNHLHMFHEQPWCAAEWWIDHLGFRVPSQRNPQTGETVEVPIPEPCDVPIGDPSWPSLEQQGTLRDPRGQVQYQNGGVAWYSRQCQPGRCAEGANPLVSSRGQVLDHVGFTYPDLDKHIPRLRSEGVTILEEIQPFGDTRAALIEDLDGLAIMLVERAEP